MLSTDYRVNAEGRTETISQMDIFVKIDNVTLNLVAKTLSPIIGTTADHNFAESVNFLQRLNETTMNNGPGVQGMAHKLENITPEVRKEFVQVAGLVFDRARAGVQFSNYSIQSQYQSNTSSQRDRIAQNPYMTNNANVAGSNYGANSRSLQTRSTQPPSILQRIPAQRPTVNPFGTNQQSRHAQGSIPQRRIPLSAMQQQNVHPQQPVRRVAQTPGYSTSTQSPVQQSFSDQNSAGYQPRAAYSSSRLPYSNNPYYNNRNNR